MKLIRQTQANYGSTFREDLFEQYKLYVESAQMISERRVAANNYLLTVNALVVTLYSLLAANRFEGYWTILVPIAGALIALTWHRTVTSYRDLNTVKFQVIHELEEHMPASLFAYEWQKAEKGKGKKYHPLSHLERWIPIIFMILYLLLCGAGVFKITDCHSHSHKMYNACICGLETGNRTPSAVPQKGVGQIDR